MNTPRRTIRIDELWDEAKAVAVERGDNLPDVIRDALRAYVDNQTGDGSVAVLTKAQLNEALAKVWDAAIASLVYHDGSAVEVMSNANPYRSTP